SADVRAEEGSAEGTPHLRYCVVSRPCIFCQSTRSPPAGASAPVLPAPWRIECEGLCGGEEAARPQVARNRPLERSPRPHANEPRCAGRIPPDRKYGLLEDRP